jgi:hypothetical protein
VLTDGDHNRHDPLSHLEISVDAVADLLQDTGRIHTRHMRGLDVLQPFGPAPAAQDEVRGVDRSSMHPQAQLSRTGFWISDLQQAQHLRATELHDPDRLHDDRD